MYIYWCGSISRGFSVQTSIEYGKDQRSIGVYRNSFDLLPQLRENIPLTERVLTNLESKKLADRHTDRVSMYTDDEQEYEEEISWWWIRREINAQLTLAISYFSEEGEKYLTKRTFRLVFLNTGEEPPPNFENNFTVSAFPEMGEWETAPSR